MNRAELVDTTISQYWNTRDEYKDFTLEQLREVCALDRLPFAVCAINVTGDLNIGIMLRTACLLGAERFIVYGRKKYDRRSTVGAHNYLDVVTYESKVSKHDIELDYSYFMPLMKEYDYYPVFFETGGTSIHNMDFRQLGPGKPCLVFGNEGLGIPQELTRDQIVVSIPQRGVLRSLNVSAAASIAMYEMQRQLG